MIARPRNDQFLTHLSLSDYGQSNPRPDNPGFVKAARNTLIPFHFSYFRVG